MMECTLTPDTDRSVWSVYCDHDSCDMSCFLEVSAACVRMRGSLPPPSPTCWARHFTLGGQQGLGTRLILPSCVLARCTLSHWSCFCSRLPASSPLLPCIARPSHPNARLQIRCGDLSVRPASSASSPLSRARRPAAPRSTASSRASGQSASAWRGGKTASSLPP